MQVAFKASGAIAILGAFVFGYLAFVYATDARGTTSSATIVTLMSASVVSAVYGFAGFALSELLGGTVAFLVKNDCRP